MQSPERLIVAVDIGGTFTDITLQDIQTGEAWTAKTPSTPGDPSEAFITGVLLALDQAGRSPCEISRVLHGTTVATNLILEGRTAATALLTTAGFRHVLEIGRADLPRRDNLWSWIKPKRPVPPSLVFEAAGRMDAYGLELEVLDTEAVRRAAHAAAAAGVEAIAICFLHAFANPAHERKAQEILRAEVPHLALSASSNVLPIVREYERSMATVLNVGVMPAVSTYIERLEQRLKDALRHDRARVQMGKISRFGLLELSRQRLRPALSESSNVTCPRCNGTGHIRDTESSALQVLRIIQEDAMKENTAAIHCQVPVDVAAFLLNEKRAEVIKIESRFKVNVLLLPNKHLETPHYKLERLRHDDPRLDDPKASYAMADEASKELESDTILNRKAEEAKPRQEAAVKGVRPTQPAPASVPRAERKAAGEKQSSGGLIGFIKRLFGGQEEVKSTDKRPSNGRGRGEVGDRNGDRNNRNRNNRNRNNRNKNEAGERNQTPRDGEEKADNKEVRQPNQRNGRNQQRQNKPEANPDEKVEQPKDLLTHAEVPNNAEAGEGDDRRRGRNRRGRSRGRDRADRPENTQDTNVDGSDASAPVVAVAVAASVVSASTESLSNTSMNVESSTAAPAIATPAAAPAVVAPAVVAPANVSVEAPVAISIPAPAPTPVPAPMPKVEFQPLKTSELTSVIESAGMVWVNTDHQKLEEVRVQIAAEPVIATPPREPKPPVEVSKGPMVLVETGGKEQTIEK